ncbi:hypothetical protein LCGC14_0232620 [marine sediment metagenome]|uniref:Uncharacterized protein n=1 Tax=marine sediment metagenome TaxID=412755 RepID=A0A0F9WUV4_9ZZZZ
MLRNVDKGTTKIDNVSVPVIVQKVFHIKDGKEVVDRYQVVSPEKIGNACCVRHFNTLSQAREILE